ncbi:MAG: hypothetical protein ACRD2T_01040, partial [Thermoanaerobaculia bacterium]
ACAAPSGRFVRADASGDGNLQVSDAVGVLFTLFGGVATDCEDALDADDDGRLGVADALRILHYLFRGGPAPPAPFPAPGADPTEVGDALGCRRG